MLNRIDSMVDVVQWIRGLVVSLAILFVIPLPAVGAALQHVKWEGLWAVVGQTVSIAMPGGAVITGKATGVESDALVVDVKKTTDPKACPKGTLRVPRATLHVFRVRNEGRKFRILGTALGGSAGFASGAAAFSRPAFLLDDYNWGAMIGLAAAGAAVGYLAGNAADRRWKTIKVLPCPKCGAFRPILNSPKTRYMVWGGSQGARPGARPTKLSDIGLLAADRFQAGPAGPEGRF